jgi:tubulin polyglutamylase TTLL4
LKPSNSSCGKGIRVVQGSNKISSKDDTIVSLYLDKPFLINGRKFDMRMYVVVTSFHPLRVYFYQDGLARFATENYSNDPKVLKNKFVHLTNFSVNKKNLKNFVVNNNRNSSKGRAAIAEEDIVIDEDPE